MSIRCCQLVCQEKYFLFRVMVPKDLLWCLLLEIEVPEVHLDLPADEWVIACVWQNHTAYVSQGVLSYIAISVADSTYCPALILTGCPRSSRSPWTDRRQRTQSQSFSITHNGFISLVPRPSLSINNYYCNLDLQSPQRRGGLVLFHMWSVPRPTSCRIYSTQFVSCIWRDVGHGMDHVWKRISSPFLCGRSNDKITIRGERGLGFVVVSTEHHMSHINTWMHTAGSNWYDRQPRWWWWWRKTGMYSEWVVVFECVALSMCIM